MRVQVIGVKITVNIRGKSKGKHFCFELAGNSSYRGFELLRLNLQSICEANPKESTFSSS